MSNPQPEPSMEEILASIRKIISEDTFEGGAPAGQAAPAQDDVLELTHEVVEAPVAPAPIAPVTAAPAPIAHNDIFSDHARQAMEDTFNSIPDEPRPAPVRRALAIAPVEGSSVENVFERAVRESFEPLLQKYLDNNADAVLNGMKPLIREWMDEHFPALLEGAVRAEVERVVRSRGAKR